MLHPALTTVRVFPEQIGQHLAEALLNRLTRADLPAQQFTIPTQLVKRDSCRSLLAAQVERREKR